MRRHTTSPRQRGNVALVLRKSIVTERKPDPDLRLPKSAIYIYIYIYIYSTNTL